MTWLRWQRGKCSKSLGSHQKHCAYSSVNIENVVTQTYDLYSSFESRDDCKALGVTLTEQTKILADQFQQIAPIYRPYDRLDATAEFTEAVLERAKKSIDEAIMYFPESDKKTDLIDSLATFLDVAGKYIEAGAHMEELAMAGGKARGSIAKAHLKWINRREEIALQLARRMGKRNFR